MSTRNILSVSTIFSEDAKWILPDNVIQKILLGLPAIDLVLLKGVCKYWRSLISSADFAAAHLNRSNSDSSRHCLIVHNDFPLASFTPPPGPFKSFICLTASSAIVVGSVNGLICLAGTSVSDDCPPENIIIFNPSTGLSTKLPPPTYYHLRIECHMVKFAFWCDDGVYKVAKIYSDSTLFYTDMSIECEIWDSSTNTWTPITPILGLVISKRDPWVSAPDVLIIEQEFAASAYWIFNSHEDVIVLSLDLKTLVLDVFSVSQIENLTTPESLSLVISYEISSLFGASIDGNFVFLHTNNLYDDGMYDLWTTGVDGQGVWNKKSEILFDFPIDKCLNCVNGKLIFRGDDSLVIYDMKTGTKDVFEFKSISATSAHDFVGTLVSIQGFEYNVKPNADIDVSWPYSCGSASSERRTGRAGKNALEGIYQSEWELVLEQHERNLVLSKEGKKSNCSDESEGKEKEFWVMKKRIDYLEMVFKSGMKEIENSRKDIEISREEIENSSKEIENSSREIEKMMEMNTLQSHRKEKENVLALVLKPWVVVGSSSLAAVALLGVVCYLQQKRHY